jgi:xanthine dehydrogenase YagS FAD-binding subunit
MKSFVHTTASNASEAVAALTAGAATQARLIAGGTDLLTLMKAELAAPRQVIDLKPARALRYVRFAADGRLQIGALTTLADLERDATVAGRLPILTQAVCDAATPQLRAMATVGGNLLQRNRCWYFRGPYPCWLKGGERCFARHGENKYHAIFDDSACVAPHPSDLAPALVALDAEVLIQGPAGERRLAVAELLQPPAEEVRVDHRLAGNEVITAIEIPPQPAHARGVYLKAMDRHAWSFALVSAAAQVALHEGVVEHVRLVLGGVSNVPRRVRAAEALLVGQPLTPELLARVADAAVAGATPLAHNGYKVPMARTLARRALARAAGLDA